MIIYYSITSVRIIAFLAAITALYPSAGICETGSWEITLSNGNVVRANSVGYSGDALVIGYKLGEAEVAIGRVDYVTHSGGDVVMLQTEGEYLRKTAGTAVRNTSTYSGQTANIGAGSPGGVHDKVAGSGTRWSKGGTAGGGRVAFMRERMAMLSGAGGKEITALTDAEEEQAKGELEEVWKEFFPEPDGKR